MDEVKLEDASVSRYHAELVRGDEHWLLSDLESKNGSALGDRVLSAPGVLRDGDLCRFGSVGLQFFLVQAMPSPTTESLYAAGLTLDSKRMMVLMRDQSVALTETEFRLLAALMRRPGRVLSILVLMRSAYPRNHVVVESTVASHLRNLRQKLATLEQDRALLRSYYGRGYALEIV